MVAYKEYFSVEDGVIGLRVIKNSTMKQNYGIGPRYIPGGKCWTLHYGPEAKTYTYVVGECFETNFYASSTDLHDLFIDVFPYWLTPHHRARVRSLLTRFHELVRKDPVALRTMGMAAFLKLEKLLGPVRRARQ